MSMNNVFPESMNKVSELPPEEALKVMQEYIYYMCERIDFYVTNMSKTLNTQNEKIADVLHDFNDLKESAEMNVGKWKLVANNNGFSIRKSGGNVQ